MDELNYFVHDQGIPQPLAIRLRAFFRNTQHMLRARRYDELLSKMSTSLWAETSYLVARRSLQTVQYLADPSVEPEFLLASARRAQRTELWGALWGGAFGGALALVAPLWGARHLVRLG